MARERAPSGPMWRYLKAAFLVGVPVPGLGRVPVNAMGVFGLGVLGFVEPSVWLVGLGLKQQSFPLWRSIRGFKGWLILDPPLPRWKMRRPGEQP